MADKFTVVIKTAGVNFTELGFYCRERGMFPVQMERWRQTDEDGNETAVQTLKKQKKLEMLRAQDQQEITALKQELQPKEMVMTVMADLLVLEIVGSIVFGGCGRLSCSAPRKKMIELISEAHGAGACLL